MTRIADPSGTTPDVIVESSAAGFGEIGHAVAGLLAASLARIRTHPQFTSVRFSHADMTTPFYVRRETYRSDPVYVQGKWRPSAGGVLFVSTASNWGSQVARAGHAVLDGYPVVHVLDRDDDGRPSDIWVIDVVDDWFSPYDPAREPIRVYFGARPARVRWLDNTPTVIIDPTHPASGAVPVEGPNATPHRSR